MDQNSSNSSSNPPQTDTPLTEDIQSVQTPPSTDLATQSEPTTPTVSPPEAPVGQSSPVDPQTTDTNNDQEQENYIENVGGDMIGMLDEISTNDKLLQEVADEMHLDTTKVKSILTPLLDKIDQGQITSEEIAIILAATVTDELTDVE